MYAPDTIADGVEFGCGQTLTEFARNLKMFIKDKPVTRCRTNTILLTFAETHCSRIPGGGGKLEVVCRKPNP